MPPASSGCRAAATGRERWWDCRDDRALAAALAVAAALFLLPGFDQPLLRDNGITLYGAIRFARGELYYASIFENKGPLAPMLFAAGVAAGRVAGLEPVYAVRLLSLAIGLAIVAVCYMAARELGMGRVAGFVCAVAVACAAGLSLQVLGGPRVKLPFVLFEAMAVLYLLQGRYFVAGLAAGCAALVWQPGVWFALVAVGAALVGSRGRRLWSALAAAAGAAAPILAVAVLYAAAGHFRELWEGAVVFNIRWLSRDDSGGLLDRLRLIRADLWRYCGGALGAWGLAAVAVWCVHRVWSPRLEGWERWAAVLAALAGPAAWTALDYQSYPDLFPFVPFVALGLGLVADLVVRAAGRRGGALVVASLIAAMVWTAKPVLHGGFRKGYRLFDQQRLAEEAKVLAGGEGRLVSLGAPHIMALTGWRNPTRYGFIIVGIDEYIEASEPGGFEGWARRVLVERPTRAVLVGPNSGHRIDVLVSLLERHYRPVAELGDVTVYVRQAPGSGAMPGRGSG